MRFQTTRLHVHYRGVRLMKQRSLASLADENIDSTNACLHDNILNDYNSSHQACFQPDPRLLVVDETLRISFLFCLFFTCSYRVCSYSGCSPTRKEGTAMRFLGTTFSHLSNTIPNSRKLQCFKQQKKTNTSFKSRLSRRGSIGVTQPSAMLAPTAAISV